MKGRAHYFYYRAYVIAFQGQSEIGPRLNESSETLQWFRCARSGKDWSRRGLALPLVPPRATLRKSVSERGCQKWSTDRVLCLNHRSDNFFHFRGPTFESAGCRPEFRGWPQSCHRDDDGDMIIPRCAFHARWKIRSWFHRALFEFVVGQKMSVGESRDASRDLKFWSRCPKVDAMSKCGQFGHLGSGPEKWPNWVKKWPNLGPKGGPQKGTPKRSHFTNFSELFKLFADDIWVQKSGQKWPKSDIFGSRPRNGHFLPKSGSGDQNLGPELKIWVRSKFGQIWVQKVTRNKSAERTIIQSFFPSGSALSFSGRRSKR